MTPAGLALAPIFLLSLLLVRALPALLYTRLIGAQRACVAGLLQAISLSFIVTAAQIGMELGQLSAGTGAALVAAGLLSVLVLPVLSSTLLHHGAARDSAMGANGERALTMDRHAM